VKSFIRGAVVTVTAAGMVSALAVPASAVPGDPVETIASGFAGPTQVAVAPNGDVIVADGFLGAISRIDAETHAVSEITSMPAFTPGVEVKGQQVYFTASTEPEQGLPQGRTLLMRVTDGEPATEVADLLAWELAHNPDGQPHNDDDAWSNPYAVLALPGRVLVADAAANDIIEVRSNGAMRTLAVFPVSRAGDCATATNNGVPNGGCDPVPTDLALGPDGYLYVSGLGAEVEGFIWKVNAWTGEIVDTTGGLPPLTGIAVADDGTVFASSLFTGQVFRFDGGGVAIADVPGPAGLDWADGVLYAGSIDFSGGPGLVLAIRPAAFQ
jgi:hypothetical protein